MASRGRIKLSEVAGSGNKQLAAADEQARSRSTSATEASNPPVKRFGILSEHEGELSSRADSETTISFAYFRGNYPGKKAAAPTPNPL